MPLKRVGIALVAVAALAVASLTLIEWRDGRLVRKVYHHGLKVVTVASGLDVPWSLVFLPDGRMLATERGGTLRLLDRQGGHPVSVQGVPPVWAKAEGGLLGLALDPAFATSHWVYWTYAEAAADGGTEGQRVGIAIARGRLENDRLADVQVIFRDPDKLDNGFSFGSRLAFTPDDKLLVTLGDRRRHEDAQRLDSVHGKILRLEPDGSIPKDNPFVGVTGAHPAIWALGFRDPQGITVEPATGRVWAVDHGPAGGDELNLILRGHNYGWPVISYGTDEETGNKIGEGTAKAGMDQPAIWWGTVGVVPPTGLTFLTSDRYPGWRGQLFMGTLGTQSMIRISTDGAQATELQRIYSEPYRRIRDVKQGPDGWLYLITNAPGGAIIRLERE